MLSLAMASAVDLTARPPPVRIPKLKYRNPLPSGEVSTTSQSERPTVSESQAFSVVTQMSSDTASLASPSLASTTSSVASSNDAKSSRKKKKTSSVLSFLSLKEPSQSALDQFAEQQRKQATGKASAASLSNTSSYFVNQKLPRNVPKVNSKWDGIPGAKNNRHLTASASTKDNQHSLVSRSSWSAPFKELAWNDPRNAVTSDDRHKLSKSLASPLAAESNRLDRWDSIGHVSPVTTTPELSYFFPDALTEPFGASPSIPLEDENSSGGLPSRLSDSTLGTRSSMDESAGSTAVSPASSTDSINTMARDTTDTVFRKRNDQPHRDLFGDGTYAVQPPDTERVPESHDLLFDVHLAIEKEKDDTPTSPSSTVASIVPHYVPAQSIHSFGRSRVPSGARSHNNRTLSMTSYRRTPSSSALPTVYEASLTSSTESLGTNNRHIKVDEDVHSIAPSAIASPELPFHWSESPRERLGLGGRLKMNDVSPWDGQAKTQGKLKKSRLSTFLGIKT